MPIPAGHSGGPVRFHAAVRPDGAARFILLVAALAAAFAAFFAGTPLARAENAPAPAPQAEVPPPQPLTIEGIAERLAVRFRDVDDITARIQFVQVSPRDGSRSQGELLLQAIFPDLARAAWLKPDFLSGIVWILDTQRNRFTQYEPTTGAARHHPLSEVMADQALIPLAPEQLFSLPSEDYFALSVEELPADAAPAQAVVRAVDTRSGKVYRIWVDTAEWLVTRIESLTADGRVELSAWAAEIHINRGLTKAELRQLPPGTKEISLP